MKACGFSYKCYWHNLLGWSIGTPSSIYMRFTWRYLYAYCENEKWSANSMALLPSQVHDRLRGIEFCLIWFENMFLSCIVY
jgi:hypothetical protein